jgi:hypothetical protein
MAKAKPKPKKRDIAQSQRFKEAARAIGADESGQAFDRAFRKIVPPKIPKPATKES